MWQVTLKERAYKIIIDSAGKEIEVPMNGWLEIGIYEENQDELSCLQQHRLRSGEWEINLACPVSLNMGVLVRITS